MNEEINNSNRNGQKGIRLSGLWITVIVVGTIIMCSLVSWGVVSVQAAPKTDLTDNVTGLNNTLQHMQDAETGLGNFADNLNQAGQSLQQQLDQLSASAQQQIDDLKTSSGEQSAQLSTGFAQVDKNFSDVVSGINNIESQLTSEIKAVQDQAAGVKTSLDSDIAEISTELSNKANQADLNTMSDTLNTEVKSVIGGLEVTPSVTTTTSSGKISGTIHLSINSDIAQTIAFRIEFRPQTDVSTTKTTYDTALPWCVATPPVKLTDASAVVDPLSARSDGTGDYNLYMKSDSKYYVSSVIFTTKGISLQARTTLTKDIHFLESDTTDYDIIITPVYLTSAGS